MIYLVLGAPSTSLVTHKPVQVVRARTSACTSTSLYKLVQALYESRTSCTSTSLYELVRIIRAKRMAAAIDVIAHRRGSDPQQQPQQQPVAPPPAPEVPAVEEFPPPPERPSRPRNFSRSEAYSDPDSESARYLDAQDDWRAEMDEYNSLKSEYFTTLIYFV